MVRGKGIGCAGDPPRVARQGRRPRREIAGQFAVSLARHALQSPLVEPLSHREGDVLRLLPTELSSPEIAQQIYISKNTARSHIVYVYGKLGVHSREDAVQRAEELGLL